MRHLLYNVVYKRRARRHNPQKVHVEITRGISHYFQYFFEVVVKYASMGITDLNTSYFRVFYSHFCQDISQMTISFYFCTTEKKGALLIGHGCLYGTLRYVKDMGELFVALPPPEVQNRKNR